MSATEFERLSRDPAFQEMFRSGHRRHVPKGQRVLMEGDQPNTLYLNGVRLQKCTPTSFAKPIGL